MVKAAEAQGDPTMSTQETPSSVDALWTCGIILAIIGAFWALKTVCSSVRCCIRRLCVKSPREHTGEDEESENEGVPTPLSMRPPRMRRTPTRSRGYVEKVYAATMEGIA